MKKILYSAVLMFLMLTACDSEEAFTENEIQLTFPSSGLTIPESESTQIALSFNGEASSDGEARIRIISSSATYGQDYTTIPEAVAGIIPVSIIAGDTSTTISINTFSDTDNFVESLELQISSTSSRFIQVGNPNSINILIGEENAQAISCGGISYETGTLQCTPSLSNNQLDIVTWNIEFFPMRSTTLGTVRDIILDLDADVYAVQEINDIADFNQLIDELDGYDGIVRNIGGSLDLGYIYKRSEITSFSAPVELNLGVGPREPVESVVTHRNGLTVRLLNIHLKCCGGSDNEARRTDASEKIKNYLDTNYPNDEVIVLGDWNEDLTSNGSFSNFISDSENYLFSDRPIGQGSSSNWSYPSFPSHIDHILISDELCDNLVSSHVIRLGDCVSSYSRNVSDHRPVITSLRQDQ